MNQWKLTYLSKNMVTSKKSLSTSISISKASDETITDDTDNAIPNDIEVPLYYCDENISVKAVNQTRWEN